MKMTIYKLNILLLIILVQSNFNHLSFGANNQEAQCGDKDYCELVDGARRSSDRELSSSCSYRVATLELYRKWGNDCKSSSELNLNIFEKAARLAAENGAKMLVFPEDGIMYEPREDLVNCIEEIPDPEKLSAINRNPCVNAFHYNKSMPILVRLSCIARENNIYLIANYGTRQSCEPDQRVDEEVCPQKGYFMLNTNVVLDPDGNFIKRYRKYNIYSETEIFDKAPSLEHVYFDTPYGRFGVFTCFDLIFKQPAIDLVELYNIDTVIFPTWWFDELPMLAAVQYQDGWSWKNNVNFISANILRPSLGSVGSAIISRSQNILNTGRSLFHNDTRTRLLIANIAKSKGSGGDNGKDKHCDNDDFNPKLIDLDGISVHDIYAHKNTEVKPTVYMNTRESSFKICQASSHDDSNIVCCSLEYKYEWLNPTSHLVFIMNNSPRAGFYGWHEQYCTVATVKSLSPSLEDIKTKGYPQNIIYSELSSFKFEKLSIHMNTTSKYVYPIGAQSVEKLISRKDRLFKCDYSDGLQKCEHSLIPNKGIEVNSFGMYARLYEGDVKPKEKITPRDHYVPGRK